MFRVMVPHGAPIKEKVTKTERDAAKAAAWAASPRVYQLDGLKAHKGKLRFIALGCQGSASDAQSAVANAIHEYTRQGQNKRPDFILLLGDNFYPKGVTSPRSSQFDTSFQKPYAKLIEENIPFFVITGNHDYNMRDEARFLPASKEGKDQILNEVAYSYLPDERKTTEEKIALFQGESKRLKLDTLPAWNMPARYYALDAGDTRIICLDSSTYIADYLIKHQPDQTILNNQALWLEHITAEAKEKGQQCLLAMHHPAYSPGKRAFKNDVALYLNEEQRHALRETFDAFDASTTPYNAYLKACLEQQGLNYDLILTAHDHNQYYYNDGKTKQLTAGGGGGPTQFRSEFAHQASLGCFLKDHGYSIIKTKLDKPEQIDFSIRPLRYNPLFFSNKSASAKRQVSEHENLTKLIAATKQAINAYFDFIASKLTPDRKNFLLKNSKHGEKEIKCAHHAWALINAKKIENYANLVNGLYVITKKTLPIFRDEAEHAFSRLLDEALAAQFGEGTTLKTLLKAEQKPSLAKRS